jgi:hypothetical protein
MVAIFFLQEQKNRIVLVYSVAKGPKFRPQSSKRAEQNLVGQGKSGAELLPDLSKKGRKGAEQFLGLVFHKNHLYFLPKTRPINWFT